MRRCGWFWIAVLLSVLGSSCHGIDQGSRSHHRTASTTTTAIASAPTPSQPFFKSSEAAHLGGTLAFNATRQLSTGPQTAVLLITLDRVIDPSPLGTGSEVPSPGYRNVELRVTMTNEGGVIVPSLDEGDPGIASLQWAIDPEITKQYGAPVYGVEEFPSESCGNTPKDFPNGVAPGQTVTGCVRFSGIPDGTKVTSASVLLLFAGTNSELPGEWLIP